MITFPNVPDPVWRGPLPLLPLRDIVVFPGMGAPLFVGRIKSINALNHAFASPERMIMLAAQKSATVNEPSRTDIFETGCVAEVTQILRLQDGSVKAMVEGRARARIVKHEKASGFISVRVEPFAPDGEVTVDEESLLRVARSFFARHAKITSRLPKEVADDFLKMEHPGQFADAAGSLLTNLDDRQKILGAAIIRDRLESLIQILQMEIETAQIDRKVRTRVKKQIEKSQRDYYLTEQMKAIQKELGKSPEEDHAEFGEIGKKIRQAGMPQDVEKKALKELSKLAQMPPMSAEVTVSRNYIDWLVDVPWKERTQDKLDIAVAEKILNEDHHGLEKVKDRILEHLSVKKLVERMKGPILLFVGPPGVGKTSLGRSIARAMGRKFVRFSLGGVRDEAEIRGHRRTYIGALPGRIVQSMKKAGVKNPVIMLDEVDKLSSDFRGDPASALLEALDPEQNHAFNDHYLEVDYDLSEVMFITTANTLHSIPRPLLDRMEVISVSGYTDVEKEEIAKKHLIPKQEKEHGLPPRALDITDEALRLIIRGYTKEAGVRNLEREIGAVIRKLARKVAEKSKGAKVAKSAFRKRLRVTQEGLVKYLGEIKFRDDEAEKKNEIGVATGLAWTELGGSILKIETVITPGSGKFILTGKLGEVMKESAQAALSFIRSRAAEFGLSKGFQNKIDIHIHIPEGATPKEGPSAGVTLATSMASALLRIPARGDTAMTGEITLRGRILPIGGLKEKLLAAGRAGVKRALIPKDNERDLREIPSHVTDQLEIIPIETIDEALRLALSAMPGVRRKTSSPKGPSPARKSTRKRHGPAEAPGQPLN
jgi:ATP-dependent Lon protease